MVSKTLKWATVCGIAACLLSACATPAFDFQQANAISLLNHLARHHKNGVYTVQHKQQNWVKKQDIPMLIQQLDNNQPAMPVVLITSSYLPNDSTIGNEAALLIEGYQQGSYPPRLHSKNYTAEEKQALRHWWLQHAP